jgi:transposase InsO family protein
MIMSYSKHPNLPKVRAEAVKMVRTGHSVREVARHFGYTHSAIVKWCKKVPAHTYQYRVIVTESSRPNHHPKELPDEIVQQILALRSKTRRGAEFIHYLLQRDGVAVSLSSVKRTLSRHGLTKYSKWKKWHQSTPRPMPALPGLLVETDTIHDGPPGGQLYIYTLLDVCSRWAYAEPSIRITAAASTRFLAAAVHTLPFYPQTIQTDHGAEFSTWFTKKLQEQNIAHRYSRVGKPNDNAHLERFNRTIQEECIFRLPRKLEVWQREIPDYLRYYNNERPHMGLSWLTPAEKLQQVVPRY